MGAPLEQHDETPQTKRLLNATRQALPGADAPLTARESGEDFAPGRRRRPKAVAPLLRRHSKGSDAVFTSHD
jgi:hypothetical protein